MGTLVEVDSVNAGGVKLTDIDPSAVGAGSDGSIVAYVKSRRAYFVLTNPCSFPVDHSLFESVLDTPSARWARLYVPNNAQLPSTSPTSPLNIYIDPLAGDDDNDGSSATPMRTALETCRRLRGLEEVKNVFFNVLGPMPGSDRFEFSFGTGVTNTQADGITIQGQQVKVATGLVVASAVARSPSTDQPQTITVTGFDWTPHVGRIVRKSGANIYASVAANLGGGTARLDDPYDTTVSAMASFSAGDTVDVLEMTDLGGGIHARGDVLSLRVRDATLNFSETKITYSGAAADYFAAFLRCVFKGGMSLLGGGNVNFTKCAFLGTPTQPSLFDFFIPGNSTNCMWKDAIITYHNCRGGYAIRQGFLQRASLLASEHVTVTPKGDALWAFDVDPAVMQFPQAVIAAVSRSSVEFNDSVPLVGGGCTTPNLFNAATGCQINWFSAAQAPHNLGPAQSTLVTHAGPNIWPMVDPVNLASIGPRS